jgi:glutamate-ammonia-ligase adenylyltransferase
MTPKKIAQEAASRADAIDPSRAAAGAMRWRRALAECLGHDPGAPLDEPRRMLAMLKIFGATRRLADLCFKYPVFAGQAFLEGPGQSIAEAARDLTALNGGLGAPDALHNALAPLKSRTDIAIALAEVSGQWASGRATAARADFAERIVETALLWLVRAAIGRGELPAILDESSVKGVFALAGGDFAHEDLAPYGPLDLLVVYDPAASDGQSGRMAERAFARLGAELREAFEGRPGDYPLYSLRTPLGSGVNGAGFVESAPRVAAALRNPQQAGVRRWIAAARVVAGDRRAGGEFLESAEELVWSASELLDEDARADLLRPSDDPRQPFRAAADLFRWSLGRSRACFRTASAREVFKMAAEAGLLAEDVAARLSAGAEFVQSAVSRAQIMKGAAAFGPASDDEQAALACLCGYAAHDPFAAARDGAVADARNALLRLLEGPRAELVHFRVGERAPRDDIDKLEDLGFRNGSQLSTMVDGWAELCAAGGASRFSEIAPGLLTAFGETQHPDEAARLFDRILRLEEGGAERIQATVRAGARRGLIDALGCFGAAIAPLLESAGEAGALFAETIDSPRGGEEWIARHPPPRAAVEETACWRRREIGRVAFAAAGGIIDFDAAASALSAIHLTTLETLFEAARAAHGPKPEISLHMFDGPARGLPGYGTPLGFVAGEPASESLESVARGFIESLAALGDGIFAVSPDVSHRPGGIAGPLAPDAAQFKSYIHSEAVAQDQLLLARARVVAGGDTAKAAAWEAIRSAVANPRRADVLLRDVDRARAQRLRRDRNASPWDIEQAEGGLFDVELIISTLIYRHAGAQPALQTAAPAAALDLMGRTGVIAPEISETLKGARAFWLRLATARALARWSDPQREPVRPRFAALLARAAEVDSFAQLRPIMRGYAEEVSRLYAQLVLGRPSAALAAHG